MSYESVQGLHVFIKIYIATIAILFVTALFGAGYIVRSIEEWTFTFAFWIVLLQTTVCFIVAFLMFLDMTYDCKELD